MAGTAGQNKQMPDKVTVADPIVKHVKDDTDGIGQTTGCQPEQAPSRHALPQGLDGYDHQPAHG